MYLFEEKEFVIYPGDPSTVDESRKKPSLAIVDVIDPSKKPYVGLKLFPSNEKMGVHAGLIRSINTTEQYLKELGFEVVEKVKTRYFTLGHIVVAGVVLYPSRNYIYNLGFRLLPGMPYSINMDDLMTDGKVNESKLEEVLPIMHNLNTLLEFLRQHKLTDLSVTDIFKLDILY